MFLKSKNTWFLRGDTTSTLVVQATEQGKLAQSLRRALKGVRAPDGGLTSVMEKAGKSVLAGLARADPCRSGGCHWSDRQCPVVEEKSCWVSRVVYRLECTLCGAAYIGTTGLTLHARGLQHLEALVSGENSYPMTKHYASKHPEVSPGGDGLKITSITGHIQDNSKRYISEAVAIAKAKEEGVELLNSKGEWSRVALRRLTVSQE